jgi:predicted transcriptional regulator
MDVLYRRGEATAAEVQDELPDPPGYGAVRRLLTIMQEKQLVDRRQEGPRYVYRPAQPTEAARASALDHLLGTFFGGSVERAMHALLRLKSGELGDAELERLGRMITEA